MLMAFTINLCRFDFMQYSLLIWWQLVCLGIYLQLRPYQDEYYEYYIEAAALGLKVSVACYGQCIHINEQVCTYHSSL